MDTAMKALGRVVRMLKTETMTEELRATVAQLSELTKDVEGIELPEAINWDQVSEALDALAAERTAFTSEGNEQTLEAVDAIMVSTRDELGYAETAPAVVEPVTEEPVTTEPAPEPEVVEEPKAVRTLIPGAELATALADRGRELVVANEIDAARTFNEAIVAIREAGDNAIYIGTDEDIEGLGALGDFHQLGSLPDLVVDYVTSRVKDSISGVEPVNAGVAERSGTAVDQFAQQVNATLANTELSRSAKMLSIQSAFDSLGGVMLELVNRSTPTTDADVLDTVMDALPQLLDEALKRNVGMLSAPTDLEPTPTQTRRTSLDTQPATEWKPSRSGTQGFTPSDLARRG